MGEENSYIRKLEYIKENFKINLKDYSKKEGEQALFVLKEELNNILKKEIEKYETVLKEKSDN